MRGALPPAEAYIARLIAKGYKVAICEQTEDPAQAKGAGGPGVIRVVTPGTLIEDACWRREEQLPGRPLRHPRRGGAVLGTSPPERWSSPSSRRRVGQPGGERAGPVCPREVLSLPGAAERPWWTMGKTSWAAGSSRPEAAFALDRAWERVRGSSPRGLDQVPQGRRLPSRRLGALLDYLYATQKTDLSYLHTLRYYATGQFLELDPVARRNLELAETIRGKEKKGSLLWVLDKTKTAMGGRLLRSWMDRPSSSPVAISRRLEAVGWLVDNAVEREELLQVLREIPDLERLISRIVYGTAGAGIWWPWPVNWKDSPAAEPPAGEKPFPPGQGPGAWRACRGSPTSSPGASWRSPPSPSGRAASSAPATTLTWTSCGNCSPTPRGVIAKLEAAEKEKTGIKSLKVGFNKVFGYYIEVSKSYYDQVPRSTSASRPW